MTSSNFFKKISIIGAGSFGTVIANLVAENSDEVCVYVRSETRMENFNKKKENNGYRVAENVRATQSKKEITDGAELIFAMVPSKYFRDMIRSFSEYLSPKHILIHGTKGVDLLTTQPIFEIEELNRSQIRTMSEVIMEESTIRRIGCLAGPNLSREIAEGQPAGAIVASQFHEVIRLGKRAVSSDRFKVFHSEDILGAEFAGVLKNIFAIASGVLTGLGFENNARALLITKGLHEMLYIGNKLGGDTKAFLGIAGIGDLIATCSSELSRNFTVGKRLAKGECLDDIIATSNEVAEGVRSIQIFYQYSKTNNLSVPLIDMLFKVLFQEKEPEEALTDLMSFQYSSDVNFL